MPGPKYGDFNFPSDFGFSGSSGEVRTIRPHTRRVPIKKAMGGPVTAATGGKVPKRLMQQVAKREVRKHVASAPPQGHGIKPK